MYTAVPSPGQSFKQPSETIQGQSHSIPELVERHANGIPVNRDNRLQWAEDNEELEQITISDLTDLDDLKEQISHFEDKKRLNIEKINSAKKVAEELLKTPPPEKTQPTKEPPPEK